MATLVSDNPIFHASGNPIYRFTTFAGADIVASIGDRVFGNIQAIQYAVQREVAPVYVMGAANPLAYTRGKRAVTGSLVFINFDRDALLAHFGGDRDLDLSAPPLWALLPQASTEDVPVGPKWGVDILERALGFSVPRRAHTSLRYADQIPPFQITISFLNEMGDTAHLRIEGVQIVNEGMGMSIDDVVLEKACTFIARQVVPLTRGLAEGSRK